MFSFHDIVPCKLPQRTKSDSENFHAMHFANLRKEGVPIKVAIAPETEMKGREVQKRARPKLLVKCFQSPAEILINVHTL